MSLVRYKNSNYLARTRYCHLEIVAKGYADRIEIARRAESSP
jgi:hypothetical protein